jgi:hypothetical protein
MARYVILHKITKVRLVAGTPGAPATPPPGTPAGPLPDARAKFIGYDHEGNFTFHLGANDPASVLPIAAIHVCLYDAPADGSEPTIPEDPAAIIADATSKDLHFRLDTSQNPGNAEVTVDCTAAPEGEDYDAVLILEYADGTEAETPPAATDATATPAPAT